MHLCNYSKNNGLPGLIFVRASSLGKVRDIRHVMVVYTNRAAFLDKMDYELPGFLSRPPLTANNFMEDG